MNWQIFFSTFILIFLAELGDKTQLAVMAQSAGVSSKWTVFLAGSLALILSTAVGVLAGGVLKRFVSDMNIIRIGGGVMFLIFGTLMIVDVIRKKEDRPVETEFVAPEDWMSRHVIQHAAAFEAAAAERYKKLAAKEINKEKRELYNWLAKEEQTHLEAMKVGLFYSDAENEIPVSEAMADDMPPIGKMFLADDSKENSSDEELRKIIESEEAHVQFYEALSRHCKIPRLKETFHALSGAEQVHVNKLKALVEKDFYGRVD